jgi:hypothetical protein
VKDYSTSIETAPLVHIVLGSKELHLIEMSITTSPGDTGRKTNRRFGVLG